MIGMPPVDRTEVIYAEIAREMIKAGNLSTPRYLGEPQYTRSLIATWLQAASALSISADSQIWAYRLPSFIGTTLAVLITFWGARSIYTAKIGLIASFVLASCLLIVTLTTLVAPEPLLLACAVAAQFSLLRIYSAGSAQSLATPAFVFWAAQGVGILLGALTLPLLCLTTLAALAIADRNIAWLRRLRPASGFFIMLVIAAIWPITLFTSGELFTSLTAWRSALPDALLGAQEMKWRKVPGTFILIALLATFPFILFVRNVIKQTYDNRAIRNVRFLAAWVLPYLLVLELISKKPPLYMVHLVLPAFAVAVALWAVSGGRERRSERVKAPLLPALVWLAFTIGLILVFPVLLFYLGDQLNPVLLGPALGAVVLALMAVKFLLSAANLKAVLSAIGCGSLCYVSTLGIVLPATVTVWPSLEMKRALTSVRSCLPDTPGGISLTGYNEPSARFLMGREAKATYWLTGVAEQKLGPIRFAFVEGRWLPAFLLILQRPKAKKAHRLACIKGVTLKGCRITMNLYAFSAQTNAPRCKIPERYACRSPEPKPSLAKLNRLKAENNRCL